MQRSPYCAGLCESRFHRGRRKESERERREVVHARECLLQLKRGRLLGQKSSDFVKGGRQQKREKESEEKGRVGAVGVVREGYIVKGIRNGRAR